MTQRIDAVPGFTGGVVHPDDADYDSAREVFNGLIEKRPAVVLRCRSRADIVAACPIRGRLGSPDRGALQWA
ncbi:hypothetical protein [Mycobacterium sp.]|uniref:hypothetical protein n=1 Tax=Mycobacterium sp. TaxID=1785 RepID=UPI003C73040D